MFDFIKKIFSKKEIPKLNAYYPVTDKINGSCLYCHRPAQFYIFDVKHLFLVCDADRAKFHPTATIEKTLEFKKWPLS